MRPGEIEDMTAFHAHEMAIDTPEDKRLEKWFRAVEGALGLHSLDGDQDHDGYSIDTAYAFYQDGLTADDAAGEFRSLMDAKSTKPGY